MSKSAPVVLVADDEPGLRDLARRVVYKPFTPAGLLEAAILLHYATLKKTPT